MANFVIIRELCERRGYTLTGLSERIGLSKDALQKIIAKGSTNTGTAERIAEALGVPPAIFFDGYPEHLLRNHLSGRRADEPQDLPSEREIAYLKQLLAEKERYIKALERGLTPP